MAPLLAVLLGLFAALALASPKGVPSTAPLFLLDVEKHAFSRPDFFANEGFRYSSICGHQPVANHACTPNVGTCGKAGASLPAFTGKCRAEIFGRKGTDMFVWGKIDSAEHSPAAIALNRTMYTAYLPYGVRGFVPAKIKFFNSQDIKPSTRIQELRLTSLVQFLLPKDRSMDIADSELEYVVQIPLEVVLSFHYFTTCEANGCPWSNPDAYVLGHNTNCTAGNGGDHFLKGTSTKCCPYWTDYNAESACSAKVGLKDIHDWNSPIFTVDGVARQWHVQGFHEDAAVHAELNNIVPFFLADPNQWGSGNLHVKLIDSCPTCPAGIQTITHADGRCRCNCPYSNCTHPAILHPDCSCKALVATTLHKDLYEEKREMRELESHKGVYKSPQAAAHAVKRDSDVASGVWYDTVEYETEDCEYITRKIRYCTTKPTCTSDASLAPDGCACICTPGAGTCPYGMGTDGACRCKSCPAYTGNPDDVQCNDCVCTDGPCHWEGSTADTCDTYAYPGPPSPPKDPQCWSPACIVGGGGLGVCAGSPADVSPSTCPVPAGVSPYCYTPACDGTGYCSKVFISSPGGVLPLDVHAGSCPVPAGYDPRCYWPYCDGTGNCAGNALTGTPYTAAGDFADGTPGNRPVPYTTYPVGLCTVADAADTGNALYPLYNPACFTPRCVNGVCGGDSVNFDQSCTPIDGRAAGTYNEVFVGAAWPGISAACVYYTCGSVAGELGHCVQRNEPGNLATPCENSDNNLCTNDFCNGLGYCADHTFTTGAAPAQGACVTSSCDPATGLWTTTPSAGACCGNGVLDATEECEVGIAGADSKCCINCRLQTSCADANVCTNDVCAAGKCVSTFAASNFASCPQLNASVADNTCKKVVCTSAGCAVTADVSKDGTVCATAPNSCNQMLCSGGVCASSPNNLGASCSTPSSTLTSPLVCQKLTCQLGAAGAGVCAPTADDTQTCTDNNACTTEACSGGACVVASGPLQCPPAPVCWTAGTCSPSSGKCENLPLADGTLCVPLNATLNSGNSKCYWCVSGACTANHANCLCGNGQLDAGEQCDPSIAAQKTCCAADCTGCTCGNGFVDAGEQCDFGVPAQLSCCNSDCTGCLCGNGVLDAGEACDPTVATDTVCCEANCTLCAAISHKSYVIPAAIGAGVLAAALLLAAVVAVMLRGKPEIPQAEALLGEQPAGTGLENPLYKANGGSTNPLYQDT